jgi:hypothetical protein
MSNYVTNQISLIGNAAIADLSREINRRLNLDRSESANQDEFGSIGRVLYGLDGEAARLDHQRLGASWVSVDGPLDLSEPIRLISPSLPVDGLQDHILRCAAKIDLDVIVVNEYFDEGPMFIGCRVARMNGVHLKNLRKALDTSNLNIVDGDEADDSFDEFTKSWPDLMDIIDDFKRTLLQSFKA